jgi:hypothetical protein
VFFYVAINLMMVMGLAPVVGIPLPFMSHGGSSMMTNMICIGTIMAVERWSRKGAGWDKLRRGKKVIFPLSQRGAIAIGGAPDDSGLAVRLRTLLRVDA